MIATSPKPKLGTANGDDNPGLVFVALAHEDDTDPLEIVAAPDDFLSNYAGFFQSRLGHQLVVSIKPNSRTGILRTSLLGWNIEIEVTCGEVDESAIALSDAEKSWLAACWACANATEKWPVD